MISTRTAGQRAAAELHVADARHLQQALLHDVRDRVVDLPWRARRRREREDHDRRLGRVDLAVSRVRAQRRGQVRARGVDRGLHVARGAVDVAVEVELQRDLRAAARAPDVISFTCEIAPRWRSSGVDDARRHGFGAAARQTRAHRDRREVDLRQRRDRQYEERAQYPRGPAPPSTARCRLAGGRTVRRGSPRAPQIVVAASTVSVPSRLGRARPRGVGLAARLRAGRTRGRSPAS